MHTYESLFICPPESPTERVDEVLEKIKRLIARQSGQLISEEKWGKRRLAYPISRHREGFYVYVRFSAPGEVIGALDNMYRVTDTVLRNITVKLEENKHTRIEKARKEALAAKRDAQAQASAAQAVAAAAQAAAAAAAPTPAPEEKPIKEEAPKHDETPSA